MLKTKLTILCNASITSKNSTYKNRHLSHHQSEYESPHRTRQNIASNSNNKTPSSQKTLTHCTNRRPRPPHWRFHTKIFKQKLSPKKVRRQDLTSPAKIYSAVAFFTPKSSCKSIHADSLTPKAHINHSNLLRGCLLLWNPPIHSVVVFFFEIVFVQSPCCHQHQNHRPPSISSPHQVPRKIQTNPKKQILVLKIWLLNLRDKYAQLCTLRGCTTLAYKLLL